LTLVTYSGYVPYGFSMLGGLPKYINLMKKLIYLNN
jgi:hypothetical protein